MFLSAAETKSDPWSRPGQTQTLWLHHRLKASVELEQRGKICAEPLALQSMAREQHVMGREGCERGQPAL